MQLEGKNLNKAVKRLKRIVTRSSWLKGEYSSEESGHIFTNKLTRQVLSGETEDVRTRNIDTGEWEMIPTPTYVEEEYSEYFVPSNFSVTIEDVTAARDLIKADKDKEDKELKDIKKLKFKESDSQEKRVRVLTRIVKRLLKEHRSE
jgi:hypothetical protein